MSGGTIASALGYRGSDEGPRGGRDETPGVLHTPEGTIASAGSHTMNHLQYDVDQPLEGSEINSDGISMRQQNAEHSPNRDQSSPPPSPTLSEMIDEFIAEQEAAQRRRETQHYNDRIPELEHNPTISQPMQISTPNSPWGTRAERRARDPPQLNPHRNHVAGETIGGPKRCKKRTNQDIKITALNIRGHGSTNPSNPNNKWQHINMMMLRRRIGILVVGEAHMNLERKTNIDNVFSSSLAIHYSEREDTPNAAGVAVVLNKAITNTENIRTKNIVPGHAMLLETDWHGNEQLCILAIYAPSGARTENEEFWNQISDFFDTNPQIHRPDMMLGDFNMVEEPMDRLPMKSDPHATVDAFDNLKTKLQLCDGWRETNPDTRSFTYLQTSTGHLSRLDRIYVKPEMMDNSFEWSINASPVPTDHDSVSVRITCEEAPQTGRGRFVWPTHLMYDKILKEHIDKEGTKLQEAFDAIDASENNDGWSAERNKQTLWASYQKGIGELARKRAKIVIPRLDKQINEIEAKLDLIGNDGTLTDEERALSTAVLKEKLRSLEMRRHTQNRATAKARNILYGETVSRYWSGINKAKTPRALIQRLKIPGDSETLSNERRETRNPESEPEPTYESNSQKMADMMRDYHSNLQEDEYPPDERARENTTEAILNNVEVSISDEDKRNMRKKLTDEDVAEALRMSANYKAPGLNGIPYEVWKILHARYQNARAHNRQAFNIVQTLRRVYNDIEQHGMAAGTGFSASWMCPLYKKKDRSEMANYRPISLLNSDYKIMTKALTLKLAKAAPSIINPAQAGFVPGRHIYDQIWLSKLVINLAEATEQDGAIVALDQEKAYDKIKHDYLWKTLRKYGIPDEFINTIRALYSDAETTVMVNGMRSNTPFRVRRGVRQGDPLSCLLFDIAIEPLAEALRKSELKGIDIPGKIERLIATFFADDTVVYLSKLDDFGQLQRILDKWCLASGAKFNIDKTEIIPIGSLKHRDAMRQSRYINGIDGTKIPEHVKIALEGEAIRSLGALIGNNVCQVEPWTRVIEKIDATLDRWDRSHPTMEGRRLIVMMVVGGMTQYITKVQGMPKVIEKRLQKRIIRFLWDDKTSVRINQETIYAPIEKGGRKLLDILARNEAIMVTWLQSYLNFGEDRATWAFVADALIAHHTPKSEENVEDVAKLNVFLQSWKTSKGDLPIDLQNMLKVGKKYGVRLEGLAFSRNILRQMPIWFHIESKELRRLNNSKESKCLRKNHGVRTVGEAETLAKKIHTNRHTRRRDCRCLSCSETRRNTDCPSPYLCFAKAKQLLDTLPPKWNPLSQLPEDVEPKELPAHPDNETKVFDWRITTKGNLSDAFRIFTSGRTSNSLHAREWNPDDTPEFCAGLKRPN